MTAVQKKLVKAGVANLQEFGYPDCNAENILTDMIYSKFFLSMLEENKGRGVDAEIDGLIQKIQEANP